MRTLAPPHNAVVTKANVEIEKAGQTLEVRLSSILQSTKNLQNNKK